jgi:hypothetical protein
MLALVVLQVPGASEMSVHLPVRIFGAWMWV